MPATDSDEKEIIRRAQGGDAEAATALYQRYGPGVFRYFLFRVGDQALAEDLTGEVFLQMLIALPRYQDRGAPLGAWLFRIAHARLVDHHRRSARVHTEPLGDTLPDGAPGPDIQAADRAEVKRLAAALKLLTDEQQMVVQLRFMEGYSLEATAQVLGKSINAVKAMQHRAVGRLMKELKP